MDQLLFYWHRVCECPSCSITVHRAVTATGTGHFFLRRNPAPLLLALARFRRPTVSFTSPGHLPVALRRRVGGCSALLWPQRRIRRRPPARHRLDEGLMVPWPTRCSRSVTPQGDG